MKEDNTLNHTQEIPWQCYLESVFKQQQKPFSSKNLTEMFFVCHSRKAAHWPHAAFQSVCKWEQYRWRDVHVVLIASEHLCICCRQFPLWEWLYGLSQPVSGPSLVLPHPLLIVPPQTASASQTSRAHHHMCSTLPVGWAPHRSIVCLHSQKCTIC